MNRIAIVVGHDKKEQGAFSPYLKKSEFAYHSEVIEPLPFDIYYRSTMDGYMTKMRELAGRVNAKKYDLVVELHFNSFNGVANGCECLHLNGSALGKRWSEIYCKEIAKQYGVINRGAKAVSSGNGHGFLSLMKAPAIIVEPFFGDHVESLKFADTVKYSKILYNLFC